MATDDGTCALIWPGETNSNAAFVLLNVTVVPAKEVGNGVEEACAVVVPTSKFEPKIATRDPGPTGAEYEAAFTTPVIVGIELLCAKTDDRLSATMLSPILNTGLFSMTFCLNKRCLLLTNPNFS